MTYQSEKENFQPPLQPTSHGLLTPIRPPQGTSSYVAGLLAKRKRAHRYARNPVRWGRHQLNAFYWSKQREIVNTVIRNPRTSVRSAHDTGKSFIAGNLASYWIDVHPVGSAF